MQNQIVLASASPFRRQLLENAGLSVKSIAPQVDERAVEATLEDTGVTPEEVALVLAEAKALEVSARFPEAWIIGGDQTLALDDEIFHKPADMDAARRHLLRLSGNTHHLNSAVVIAHQGKAVWRHVEVARMTMRRLSPEFIGRYLAASGKGVLKSVGCYQIEGTGVQLMERIDGDYFTIVGLPLFALLKKLRDLKLIDG